MPILLDPDPKRAATAVAAMPEGAQVVTGIPQLESWLQDRPDEYVVVLGPQLSLREAGAVADRLRSTHPSAGVVLIRSELTTEVFGAAMQAGIPAVVAADDAAALRAAAMRARQTWEAIHGPAPALGGAGGRVITVFSPKGGVGKTTIAVNLAVLLAGDATSRVCIVDLDLAFGDVAITLQVIPEHTIDEAVDAEAHLDFALLSELLTPHSENLMILSAPTTPEAKDRIPGSLVRGVLTTLRRHFEYVVVDTSPGFDDAVLQAFDETDELVLVATLDVPTVKNMKMALETLDVLDLVKEHRHLVLNRADDQVGLSAHNVEGILKLPVSIAIPTDTAVANATNHGRPIALSLPDHRVSQAMAALTAAVSGRDVSTPQPRRRGLFVRGRRQTGTER